MDTADITARVQQARAAFASGRTASLDWREEQLARLDRLLAEEADAIEEAVHADLGKHRVEAHLTEVAAVRSEVRAARRNLRRWTRDRKVRTPLTLARSEGWVHREPLGTVLVIGPWNYPVHLLLVPLVGAIAAGNSVVLKPSELAPASSAVLADLLPRYLDAEAVQVVEGAVPETTELLEQRFDHIFYTGNGEVGSIVMTAAARHLTPVTLELGGKSPVWVDESYPLEKTADWLVWGKFTNCGQTCVAPDYVLTTPELAPRLAAEVGRRVAATYGRDPRTSEAYGRIVSERHTERIARLLGSGRTLLGGDVDVAERYVAPTVLTDVALTDPVMQEEIFGPVLPILTVADHREAIEVIRSREKPLALYAFSEHEEVRADLLEQTSSGGLVFGAVVMHLAVPELPFGGVGGSGFGAYHGERSVRTFSHERAVLRKRPGLGLAALARPPYPRWKQRLLRS